MGNLFERWIYGDPTKEDLKGEDWKSNRKGLFLHLLKTRYRELMTLNLLYCLLILPLVFGPIKYGIIWFVQEYLS